MDIVIIGILIIIGTFLIILEVFFLPGITIAGIASILFFTGASWYAFSQLGTTAGFITIILSLIVTIVSIFRFMRSKALDKMSLKTDIDSVIPSTVTGNIEVGDKGITLTRLNPMGKIMINNASVEAKALDELIEEDTHVIVEKIERTVVIVKKEDKR